MKKTSLALLLVLVMILCLCASACGDNESSDETVSMASTTAFVPYTVSVNAEDSYLDFIFFTTEKGVEQWNTENIQSVILKIGTSTFAASIDYLDLEDQLRYDTYYSGHIGISVDLSVMEPCSADAYISVSFDGEEESCEYYIGEISVLPEATSDTTAVSSLVMGSVVTSDDNDEVQSYGIIAHIGTNEAIDIVDMDFGSETVGLDLDGFIIYTPDEYHSGIMDALESAEYDEYVADAYTIHLTEQIDTSAEIHLEEGEYYIYFPLQYTSEDVEPLKQAAVKLTYESENASGTFVSSSCYFFDEYTKPEDVINELFA